MSLQQFTAWAHEYLKSTDQVAIEATINSWAVHDQLCPLVDHVAVANTNKLKMITSSSKKTDPHDARILAKLFAAQLLPIIWVPPQSVRELRSITKHRTQLIEQRGSAQNRLHNLIHRHNPSLPDGDPFKNANEAWWQGLPLSNIEQLQLHHYRKTMHLLNQQIAETEAEIAQLSASECWLYPMTFLVQLSGVGLHTGMRILAVIGEIERFPSAQKLVGYSGLGARIRATGNTY